MLTLRSLYRPVDQKQGVSEMSGRGGEQQRGKADDYVFVSQHGRKPGMTRIFAVGKLVS